MGLIVIGGSWSDGAAVVANAGTSAQITGNMITDNGTGLSAQGGG